MDSHQGRSFADENVVQIQSGNLENDVCKNRSLGSIDRAVLATEDGIQNIETSFDTKSERNHEGNVFQYEEGSESQNRTPPNSLMLDLMASNHPKAIEKMLYKTKLCCKFRAGTCTLANNCSYEHSIEELREPSPNCQGILGAPKEEIAETSETREVFQIPVVEFSGETQGIYMRQYCWRYSAEGGCAYGENCYLIHDEFPEDRESVAICLLPGNGCVYGDNKSKPTVKFPNWKTRLCTAWELTGCCTFGNQCNFAHGSVELRSYDGENCNFIHEEVSEDRESVAICLLPGNGCVYGDNQSKPTVKFPNWKTRLCTAWEITGRCIFGSQCNFAHGSAELRRYDGGLANR